MPTYKKKPDFFETDEGIEAKQVLKAMALDATYNTQSSYNSNDTLYPGHQMSFVDKHMSYLRAHPATDPTQYLSNLRLMTRIK